MLNNTINIYKGNVIPEHTIHRKTQIDFNYNQKNGHLNVVINTHRLCIKSATNDNVQDYYHLFSNPQNVENYYTGKPWSYEMTYQTVEKWIKLWENNIPFSAFAVSKRDTKEFIGHVILRHVEGDHIPGSVEIGYVIDKKFWNQGYGKEIIEAIVENYAPELVKSNYKAGSEKFNIIIATVIIDNQSSIKLLEKVKMQKLENSIERYGKQRYIFFRFIEASGISNNFATSNNKANFINSINQLKAKF